MGLVGDWKTYWDPLRVCLFSGDGIQNDSDMLRCVWRCVICILRIYLHTNGREFKAEHWPITMPMKIHTSTLPPLPRKNMSF